MKRKPTVVSLALLCLFLFILPAAVAGQTEDPELPRVRLETPYPTPNGNQPRHVPAGGDLQAAIDDAQPGDTITLQPGATYSRFMGFRLRYKPNPTGAWIVIRSASSAFDSGGAIPPGVRVAGNNAEHTSQMAKIRAPVETAGTGLAVSAIFAEAGANHYRLVGLDVGGANGVNQVTVMINLGDENISSAADLPSDIVIDRCYVHGEDEGDFVHGIALNGARQSVIESHVSNFHHLPLDQPQGNGDSQAIIGWNGPGPFKIVNNYLEGADECIAFGGQGPKLIGVVPSDIEIQRNHLFKPVAWKGRFRSKNHFELKAGRRVLFNGNILENNWGAIDQGNSIVFKSASQDNKCSWCVSEHITVTNNIIRHSGDGLTIIASGVAGADPPPPAINHVKIENNLFYDIGGTWGLGRLFEIYGDSNGTTDYNVSHLKINHNTAEVSYQILNATNTFFSEHPHFTFSNNILERRLYGVGNNPPEGRQYLAAHFPGYAYFKNVIVNNSEATEDATLLQLYPSPNVQTFVAADWEAAGLVNRATEDYRLSATSPYKNQATDGKDIGCDIDALYQAINGGGTPTAVTIEAENFKEGNNGDAYLDYTPGNFGGTSHRPPTDVDIEGCLDGSCGYWISWVHAGEWQKYTFSLTGSGLYTIEARVTTQDGGGGTFHIEIDGADRTGPMTVPNTGGAWTILSKAGVSLTSGPHTMRVVSDTASPVSGWVGKFDYFKVTPPAPPVPIFRQAENFDTGNNGEAYLDYTPGDFGGTNLRTPPTDVDIEGCVDGSCGYWINWVHPGEWLKYSIEVPATATYTFEARVTAQDGGSGGTFHMEIDGVDKTGPMTVPNTGGAWTTLSKPNITLSPGMYTMRIVFDSASPVSGWVGKFDHFKLTP